MNETTKELLALNKSLLQACKNRLAQMRNAIATFQNENRTAREWLEKQGKQLKNRTLK